MEKRQLIDQIRQFNKTVEEVFLTQFSEEDLLTYLRRLEAVHRKQQLVAAVVENRTGVRLAS